MDIKKIKLKDLESFVNSDFYKGLDVKPISPRRVISYLNNPDGKADDIVLYYIAEGNKLITLRTILADSIKIEGKKFEFAWFSGSWVADGYRGRGIAQKTMAESVKDWNNRLVVANYSMMGLASYERSKQFKHLHTHEGIRAYFSFSVKKRFGTQKIIKPFLAIADVFIILISKLLRIFYSSKLPSDYSFNEIQYPDTECLSLAEKLKYKFVFQRGSAELEWILSYPWMTDDKKDYLPDYPFSSYSKEFYYKTEKVFSKKEFKGFFIFSVRDGHLKTLNFYLTDNESEVISKWLKNYMVKNELAIMTVFNKPIVHEIKKKSLPFLKVRDYQTNIYNSFDIPGIDNLMFQDGDGDYFFT